MNANLEHDLVAANAKIQGLYSNASTLESKLEYYDSKFVARSEQLEKAYADLQTVSDIVKEKDMIISEKDAKLLEYGASKDIMAEKETSSLMDINVKLSEVLGDGPTLNVF